MKKRTQGLILASFFTLSFLSSANSMDRFVDSPTTMMNLMSGFNQNQDIVSFLVINNIYNRRGLSIKEFDQLEITSVSEKIMSLSDDVKANFLMFFLRKNNDESDVFKQLEKLSETSSVAMSNLGICYGRGDGIEQNLEKAVECYEKAAIKGYAPAQCMLGKCYKKGQGVEKNSQEALKWYRKAASQKYAPAQALLGHHYQDRESFQDFDLAIKFFDSAFQKGAQNEDDNRVYKLIKDRRIKDNEIINDLKNDNNRRLYFSELNKGICHKNGATEIVGEFFKRRNSLADLLLTPDISPENHTEIDALFKIFVESGLILEDKKEKVKEWLFPQ